MIRCLAVSGKTAVRLELDHCLKALRAGDTLVVWRLDRLGRSLPEFERNLIRERTRAGLVAARARGRAGGRKPKVDGRQIREIKRLMSDPTIPVGQIAERYKVSRTTIYKVAPRSAVPASEPRSDASRKNTRRQDAT